MAATRLEIDSDEERRRTRKLVNLLFCCAPGCSCDVHASKGMIWTNSWTPLLLHIADSIQGSVTEQLSCSRVSLIFKTQPGGLVVQGPGVFSLLSHTLLLTFMLLTLKLVEVHGNYDDDDDNDDDDDDDHDDDDYDDDEDEDCDDNRDRDL